jgi:hypothetical protein
VRQRPLPPLVAVAAVAFAAAGATGAASSAGARPCGRAVSGGSAAERKLATRILCGLNPAYIVRVRIAPVSRIGHLPPPPHSLRLLVGVSSGAAGNVPPGARVRWEADLLAGAIRDSFESHRLRHLVQDTVAAPPDASGHAALVDGGTIGAAGVVPKPWQAGAVDERMLGRGIEPWPRLAATLASLDRRFGARSRLCRYQPLGEAPYVTIETAWPRQFLSGPAIGAYLAALRFRNGRYDGVFVLLTTRGAPLWMASATARGVGGSSCGTFNNRFSALVGRGQHPGSELPDQTAPAAKACAAAGIPFS